MRTDKIGAEGKEKNNNLLKRIIYELEKSRPDCRGIKANIQTYFQANEIDSTDISGAGSALMLYFICYNKINNKKCVGDLINGCNLNFYNKYDYNSAFAYFRNAREKKIKLNEKQINKIISEAEFTSNTHNLFDTYITHDRGYTKMNDQGQIIFLDKVKKINDYPALAGIFWGRGREVTDDAGKMARGVDITDSFNFELPEIRDFFDKIGKHLKGKNPAAGNKFYDHIERIILKKDIEKDVNKAGQKSRNKI